MGSIVVVMLEFWLLRLVTGNLHMLDHVMKGVQEAKQGETLDVDGVNEGRQNIDTSVTKAKLVGPLFETQSCCVMAD